MNQSGTGPQRPSETSEATQPEPPAVQRLTVDASEFPLVDRVRESRSSGDVRGLVETYTLTVSATLTPFFFPSNAHHSLAVVAKQS